MAVALITAGAAGLGAATAKAFASSGMRVVVNYHSNRERAESLVQDLEKLSDLRPSEEQKNFLSIRADMSKRAEVVRLVDETVSAMGKLDVVFSNVGWTELRKFSDLDDNVNEEDWDRCFNMNVKTHLYLMHAAKEHLEKSEGVFITTASSAGLKPSGSSLAYSVTKAAQIHLVKGLATICSPKVRVNAVSPGLMLTEWGMKFPQARQDAALAKTQLKRFTTPEDVAEQVLCLANNKSITGANFVIDAGATI